MSDAIELQRSPAIIPGQWQTSSGVTWGAGTTNSNQRPGANTWEVKLTLYQYQPWWNWALYVCRLLHSLCWSQLLAKGGHYSPPNNIDPSQHLWLILARFHWVASKSTNNGLGWISLPEYSYFQMKASPPGTIWQIAPAYFLIQEQSRKRLKASKWVDHCVQSGLAGWLAQITTTLLLLLLLLLLCQISCTHSGRSKQQNPIMMITDISGLFAIRAIKSGRGLNYMSLLLLRQISTSHLDPAAINSISYFMLQWFFRRAAKNKWF